jgi:uncharacterized OB-fold protein
MKLTKRTASHLRETPDGLCLVATRNAGRKDAQFPPLEFMHGDALPQEVLLGPTGTLYSYTVVSAGKDIAPYGLAMVDFAPGVRAFGRVMLDAGVAPAFDGAVRVVPFTLPDGTADYAFEPIHGDRS